mmetsp:Transcript_33567/g.79673  ORF Transcript_33567/g.79673 Transcript_33567/m.79673 type:complete len:212 (+) Transcript_33567:3-638(+)
MRAGARPLRCLTRTLLPPRMARRALCWRAPTSCHRRSSPATLGTSTLGTSRRAARSRPRSRRRSRFTSTLRASHRRWTSRRRLASTSRPISRAGEMREMREMVWEMVKEMAPPATAARAASCRATSTLRGKHFPPFPGAMAIGFGDAGVAAGRRALRRHRRARRHAARIGGVPHRAAAPRLDGHGRARRLPADGAQRDLLRRATRRRCAPA